MHKFLTLAFALSFSAAVSAQDVMGPPSLDAATKVYSRPNTSFMHRLKAAEGAEIIGVKDLPKGLRYDKKLQRITGQVRQEGTYQYTALVRKGKDVEKILLTLVVKDRLEQPTPFMGWFSWNVFEDEIDDAKVREVADAFERTGLKDAGYRYLCLDDCWHAVGRDSVTFAPLYDTVKFPHGMNSLADYVHGKGLKFGIYSDAAEHTCAGEFGSLGFEEQDAKAYAAWGFDLLKYDYCEAPKDAETAFRRYTKMRKALDATGRDFLFYMCEWGERKPWRWAAETGATAWRCTFDSRDKWDWGKYDGSYCGAIQAIDIMGRISQYAGVNRFNDADMMCIGLRGKGKSSSYLGANGMTQEEYKSQFSLWCMFASPLTLSCDVRTLRQEDIDILTNREMIAINQDVMGQSAELVRQSDSVDVYVKPLANGDVAVALLNRKSVPTRVAFDKTWRGVGGKYRTARNVWSGTELSLPRGKNVWEIPLRSHETAVFRLRKGK